MARQEKDSLGTIEVDDHALYGAQTQRALLNFQLSKHRMPQSFIHALALIKQQAASVNASLKLLDAPIAKAIMQAADAVCAGQHEAHFPVNVYQTGSGTSSNMNMNEVLAHLASEQLKQKVSANDHVNMSQSSNDTIPTSIHVSCC